MMGPQQRREAKLFYANVSLEERVVLALHHVLSHVMAACSRRSAAKLGSC